MIIGLQWVEKPTLYEPLLPTYFNWTNEFPLPRIGEYLVIHLGKGERLSVRVDDVAYEIGGAKSSPDIHAPTLGVRFVNHTPPVTERTTK